MKLAGKNAVVTGGSSGIGRAITLQLLGKGVSTCLLSRSGIETQAYLPPGRTAGAALLTRKGDLSSDEDLADFCEYVVNQVSSVDILVHCAGAYHTGTVEETAVNELDRLYRVNVRAPYQLTRLLLPRLRQAKGQIVFMNSSAGVKTAAKLSHYASSKYALRAFADSLRQEVNGDGVRVISVFPGRTASRMQEAVYRFEQRPYDPDMLIQPQDIAKIVVNSLKLPATAEVTDIHIRPMTKPT